MRSQIRRKLIVGTGRYWRSITGLGLVLVISWLVTTKVAQA